MQGIHTLSNFIGLTFTLVIGKVVQKYLSMYDMVFRTFSVLPKAAMKHRIDTVTARAKLNARREPYWHRLHKGFYLGYRKMTPDSEGSWLVRFMNEDTGKESFTTLGTMRETPDHQRFDAAQKAAKAHGEHLENGGVNDVVTVGGACDRLVMKYRDDGRDNAAADAQGRFNRWVHSNKMFASTPLLKLTAGMVSDWRTKLARTPAMHQDKTVASDRPRAASTLNRDMAVLKAALNLAFEDGYAASARPWSSKLKPVKDAAGRRDCYLDADQRRKLIANAAPDLAILIRAMSLLPLRPGAVASLNVASFDKRLGVLLIGKDKAGKDRKITLPPSTAAFFVEQAKDRLPSAPLCARANGAAWNKDSWKYPFKDAVIAANLSTAATAYSLRHSTITDLIALHRLDTMTVSQLSGTSIAMIEKHYGHLLRDHATSALASLTL